MKTYIFLLSVLFTFSAKAQEADSIQTPVMKAYSDFLYYTPKALALDPAPAEFGTWKLDNLMTVWLLYGYKDSRGLSAGELSWLTGRINDLAVAFYVEGKPVMLYSTGGFHGCPESEFELKKESLKGKEVTRVNFCHSCTGGLPHEDEFITIFNNRTKRLLEGAR